MTFHEALMSNPKAGGEIGGRAARSCLLRLACLISLACLIGAFASTPAVAQTAAGSLYGTVRDGSRGALSGARVSLQGLGAVQLQRTEENGQFRFLELDPGRFRLTVEHDDFAPLIYETIDIRGGRSTTIRVDLVPAVDETISITAESPLLDERKLSQGAILSQVELESLPTARDPWSVLEQAPGVLVNRVNVGGNWSGQQAAFLALGATSSDNDWQMDGAQIIDMNTRASPTYFDFDQFAQVELTTGGNDIEKSTSGVTVNLVTKRGSNELRGSARFLMTDADGFFDALDEADPSIGRDDLGPGQEALEFVGNRTDRVQDLGFEAGGPVVADRLWGWGAWSTSDIDILAGNGQPDATTIEHASIKLNAQVVPSSSLVASWTNGDKRKEGRGAGPTRAPETLVSQRGPSAIYRFEGSHVFSNSLFATATVGLIDGGFGLSPSAPGTGLDGPDIALDERGVFTQNWIVQRNVAPSELFQADASKFLGTGSLQHELVIGGRYREGEDTSGNLLPGRQLVQYAGVNFGAPFDFFDAYRSGLVPIELERRSLWVQDTMTHGRFTINLGLRLDLEEGRNSPTAIAANPALPELLPALAFDGNDAGFDRWSTIVPRLGATYAMGADRQTLLRASFARFAQALAGEPVRRVNPISEAFGTHLFFDQNDNQQWDGFAIDGPPVLVFASGFDPANPTALVSPNRNDPDLSPELTDELILGVEHALRPELVVGVNLTWREISDIHEDRPFVRGPSGDVRVAMRGDWIFERTLEGVLPDGSDYSSDVYGLDPSLEFVGGSLRINGDRSREFRGLSLSLDKRLANRWSLRGYVNYGRAKWRVPSSYFDFANPTNSADGGDRDGEIYFEVSRAGEVLLQSDWSANLNGIYQVAPERPWSFNVAGTVFARQGFPLSYFARDASQLDGTVRNVSLVQDMEDFRAPDLYMVNLRLEKEFTGSGPMRITVGLDAFNVLNETTTIRRNLALTTPRGDWLQETVAPRIYRLGARLSF